MAWRVACHGRGHGALHVRAEGRWHVARQAARAVRRRRASGLSVLEREAVRRGRHASPDRARSLRGTSEVTNLASSGRERASQRASGPGPPMPRLRRVRRSVRGGGSPDSRCSTGDPDDLLVYRAAVRDPEQESQDEMADGTLLSGQMAEGRWHVRRSARCRAEGRLGGRCWSAKPCAGADMLRLTAREASGERARLRTSRRAAGSGHRSARPAPKPRIRDAAPATQTTCSCAGQLSQ